MSKEQQRYPLLIHHSQGTMPHTRRDVRSRSTDDISCSMFTRDSKHVLSILKELTNGSQAETWMKGTRCGRAAMSALQTHYDGTSEGERRKAVAKADLKKLFYRNETTFSFEKYVTKLKHIFNVMDRYAMPLYEKDKVDHLLEQINCPDAEIKMQVSICRSSHARTFEQAATYMATEIARIFPDSQPGSGRYRGKRKVSAFRRGGGRGGRGHGGRGGGRGGRGGRSGRNGKGSDRGTKENGIDISDPCRWYEQDELSALSADTRRYILNHPKRAAAIEERKKKRQQNSSSASSTTASTQEQERFQASIITGVMNAQQNSNIMQNQDRRDSVRYPQHGSGRSVSGASRGPPSHITGSANSDDASRVTYDHNGNIVP